jgi:hypothetical protein
MNEVITGTYFVLIEREKRTKTKLYSVYTKNQMDKLGVVKWSIAWRCYAFFPDPGTFYETTCLNELATILKRLTDEQRSKWKG